LVMQLSHRDVQLDFFLYCRHLIKDLNSGEFLGFDGNGCHNSKGQVVVKFSRQFLKQIESMRQKNYVPRTAKIRFIVYWQKENTEREVRIVLPELYFDNASYSYIGIGIIDSSGGKVFVQMFVKK